MGSTPPTPDPEAVTNLTALLRRHASGDEGAIEAIAKQVYDSLHGLAQRRVGRSPANASQPATALAHEAFFKLFSGAPREWQDRAHFFKVASAALRTILVDHARRRAARPRTVSDPSVLDALTDSYDQRAHGLPALGESLERLRERAPLQAEIVELRFFGGRTLQEVAELLGTPLRSVEREWAQARAWLREDVARA